MAEPVSLDDIKVHLRLDPGETGEDTYLTALIVAARRTCETYINRAIVATDAVLRLDGFPGDAHPWGRWRDGQPHDSTIFLPGGPVDSVSSVTYRDCDGANWTLEPVVYVLDPDRVPARLGPLTCWPVAGKMPGSVTVNYTLAPLGEDDSTIVAHAIRLIVGNWYANREGGVIDVRGTPAELPLGVAWLLSSLRVVPTP